MNPLLNRLQAYPFEKLRALFNDIQPDPAYRAINYGIGEPKHATPQFIKDALIAALPGLSSYPASAGSLALREAIAGWLQRRFDLPTLNADTEVLPVAGSREALFSFAQAIVNPSQPGASVVCPNPFYQIYEGAALLAGAQPYFVNCTSERDYKCNYAQLPPEVWQRTQLLYLCTPGNPTGAVMTLEDWREVFALADRYGFVIASDECYSEIYFDEAHPPLGALQAATQLGRGFERVVMFSSLSKRSNVPGMRSGFVAGDAQLLAQFLKYRTYHGAALSPVFQSASIAAWQDERHVRENRRKYAQKFSQITPLLAQHLQVKQPDAAFYLWARTDNTGLSDTEFARQLYAACNVTVLPGSFLARDAHGINPGRNHVRIALVAEPDECLAGAQRIAEFCATQHNTPGFLPTSSSIFPANVS
jgi:N-succinyldiaminopimelate aminotransferase